ncbi:MAG: DeoD-type purine-nucleoside phosphorylase [Propionibacterium sp.]
MPTPHISAGPGEIAPLVLMPGDPRRAERIAQQTLADAHCVSEVRGIGAWTGSIEGTPVSVVASGMGIPSLSIYAHELFAEYGVRRICRVGTAGGISGDVAVHDVVIGAAAHTDSRLASLLVPDVSCSLFADFDMLDAAVRAARALASDPATGKVHVGALYSSDFFYLERPDITAALDRIGTLAVEMEAAGLYACALQAHRQALAVCTVSDHLRNPQERPMTPEEREMGYATALSVAVCALLA